MKKIQCGGFYVDDGAIETREGKPFLKTGGSDPIVDNAKETGGIGWTESGEQTTIEWDGNTSGKVVVDGGEAGAWCLVSNKTPSVQDVIGGTFYVSGVGDIEITAESIMELDNIYSFDSGTFMVAFEPTTVGGINFPYAGVYYPTEWGNKLISLTYGTPDTIHKIDEKYLPEGGGAMVVEFVADEDMNVTSNKTVDEILDAESSGTNIIGVLYQDGDDVPLAEHMILTTVVRGVENELGFVFFNTKVDEETFAITFQPLYAVYYNGTKWVAGMAT